MSEQVPVYDDGRPARLIVLGPPLPLVVARSDNPADRARERIVTYCTYLQRCWLEPNEDGSYSLCVTLWNKYHRMPVRVALQQDGDNVRLVDADSPNKVILEPCVEVLPEPRTPADIEAEMLRLDVSTLSFVSVCVGVVYDKEVA